MTTSREDCASAIERDSVHAIPGALGRRPTLLLAALAPLTAFGILLGLVQAAWAPLLALDRHTAQTLNGLLIGQDNVVLAIGALTDAGGGATWWLLLSAATLYMLMRGAPGLALFVAATGVGGGVLNRAVKVAVGRARPEFADPVAQTGGFAFPSGHAMGSVIGVSVLLIVLLPLIAPSWRRLAVTVGAMFAVAVGLSRIALGVHWVSDVVGGWLLALAWLLTMAALIRPPGDAHVEPNRSRLG